MFAPAARQIGLEIAGVRLLMSSAVPDLAIELPSEAAAFRSPSAAAAPWAPDISLQVDWLTDDPRAAVPAAAELQFDSGKLWQLLRTRHELWFRFTSPRYGEAPYKLARLSRDLSTGTIYVDRRCATAGLVRALEYPLDELLWMHWLPARRGVIVHACGLVDDQGRGYLFVGQSGAGKSTTARLWQNARPVTVLSDDRIIVQERDGRFWMSGTPWHGEAGLASPRSAPITRLLLLEQATSCGLDQVGGAVATGRLLAASFFPFHDPVALLATSQLLADLARAVGCVQLRFTPDENALHAVSHQVALSGGRL